MSNDPTRRSPWIARVGSFVFVWFVLLLCGCDARVAGQQVSTIEPHAVPLLASAAAVASEHALGVHDVGIFSDLDARVQIALPARLDARLVHALVDQPRAQLVLYERDQPLKVYPLGGESSLRLGSITLQLRPGDRAELAPLLAAERLQLVTRRSELPPGDLDDDGIPDPLDVLIGAHKTLLNADHYDGRYVELTYPLGDVPRSIGVCTDVVVRALRNAGIDLQRAVHEDIAAAPRAYPMVQHANASIDHRRVKSVLPYFERHFAAHSARLDDANDPLRAGDIVFMDTFPSRPGSEHVGIVSEIDAGGLPLIINNWTDGTVTRAMALLPAVPVTKRFRVPPHAAPATQSPIAASTTQLLLVIASAWDSTRAQLTRYERAPGKAWRVVGEASPAVIGYAGLGWGDGLHGAGAPAGRSGPTKREGDGRSPAGVFTLGALHGYAPQPPAGAALTYIAASEDQRCVDDPASALYNRVIATRSTTETFRSAERMKRDDDVYSLAIDVDHNRAPIVPGHGSCIFIHVWAAPDRPVTGCTGLSKTNVGLLARWLVPGAVMVALPQVEYEALRGVWGLP